MNNIIITHIDLDGVTSGYLAGIAFDTNVIVSANYHEVTTKLELIHNEYGSDINLIVTDLNILPKELRYALTHFNSVTIFDHHPSSGDFIPLQDINDKFKIYFNEDICATTLVATYMMDNGHEFTDIEKNFLRLTNIYDTWKHEHKDFVYARMANDLFWKYGWTHFLKKLQKTGLPDVPKGLSHDELSHIKKTFDDIANAGQSAEWYNTDCGSTIVILEQEQKVAINHISEYIPSQTGIYYIIYLGGVYRCSVRVGKNHNDDYDLGGELREFIKISDLLDSCGGHKNAAGSSFKKGVKLPEALTELETFDSFLFERKVKRWRNVV